MTSDGTNGYTWDARNRLVSTLSGASFRYDSLGRRVSKTVAGTTTNYLYDGANVAQELAGATPTANLLTGGIDEVFTRTTVAPDPEGTRHFLTDALGSTLVLADAAGALPTQYTYDPFGNTTASGVGSSNSYQYTGRELDAGNLYFYRARYYNPQISRFITEDPIGFDGEINSYVYAYDSPVSFGDPFGLDVTVTLYRGSGGFGHIGIGVNTNQTQGFYPLHVPIPISIPGYTGVIDSHNLSPIVNVGAVLPDDPKKTIDSITIHTTPDQDRRIQDYINSRIGNPGIYNLFGRNCTDFARKALRAGGIETQPGILPADPFFPLKYPWYDQSPIH